MLELLAQTTSEVDPKIQRWAMAAMVGLLLLVVLVVGLLVIRSVTRSVRRNYLGEGKVETPTSGSDAWSESASRVTTDDLDLEDVPDEDDELPGRPT